MTTYAAESYDVRVKSDAADSVDDTIVVATSVDDTTDVVESDVVAKPSALGGTTGRP